MPVGNKHTSPQRVYYPSFNGGLNLSVPAESIALNELREALNVEFSAVTGSMRVRGGLMWVARFEDSISDIVPVSGTKGFFVKLNNNSLFYFVNNIIRPVTGDLLSGNGKISLVPWSKPNEDGTDQECYVIASGGKLQIFKIDGNDITLKTIDDVPVTVGTEIIQTTPQNARMVFLKENRIGVVEGADRLKFSWVGDCEHWETADELGATDDDSKGQFIDIGYKDGMDIVAVVPLSKDLIIFKTPGIEPDRGTVFRLTGDYPNWQVLEVAHNTGTFSQQSVQTVASDVFYLSPSGLATLTNVTQYGEVKANWPDRKVASYLAQMLASDAKLWNVPDKQQLWILPTSTSDIIWVYDYFHGIWTQFQFPETPMFADGLGTQTYVAIGRDLFNQNSGYSVDDVYSDAINGLEMPSNIYAKMVMGTILRSLQTLIKYAFVSYSADDGCEAYLKLDKFKMPLRSGGLMSDIDVYDDYTPLFPEGDIFTARKRCIVRGWAFSPEIEIISGGFGLSTMAFDVTEV